MATSTTTRRPSRVPGAKILITASALAATLAGWAALTWKEATLTAAAAPGLPSVEAQLAAAGIRLDPLPTLVPGAETLPMESGPILRQSAPLPVLRSVSAPPAPVTVTQSSRP